MPRFKARIPQFGNNLLLGALLLAPIAVTFWVFLGLFNFVTDWFVEVMPEPFRTGYRELLARLAALFLVVMVLFCIGVFTRNFIGRRLYAYGDRLLSRIPGVKVLYGFIRQVIEVFFAGKDTSFDEVVLLEYPRTGVYSLGFVTAKLPTDYSRHIANAQPGEECVSVFIPTTPNPTSGWFCIVPRSQVIRLKMTPAEGMKLVVSGGSIFPGSHAEAAQTTLLEKLESRVGRNGK